MDVNNKGTGEYIYMRICHTIIVWLSRMNVKDEYVKSRVINLGGWVTGRPGVLMVQNTY